MRDVVVALQALVPLLVVLGVYARTMRNQRQLIVRVNRDDRRGVRDAVTAIIERARREIDGLG